MGSLKEMDKFLQMYTLPRLNQEKTENISRPITGKEIGSVIKQLPKNGSLGPNGLTAEFYQTLKEELTPILFKLFKILKRGEHFQTHFTRPGSP